MGRKGRQGGKLSTFLPGAGVACWGLGWAGELKTKQNFHLIQLKLPDSKCFNRSVCVAKGVSGATDVLLLHSFIQKEEKVEFRGEGK